MIEAQKYTSENFKEEKFELDFSALRSNCKFTFHLMHRHPFMSRNYYVFPPDSSTSSCSRDIFRIIDDDTHDDSNDHENR